MKKHPKVIITDHYKKKQLRIARKRQEKKAANTARQKSKKTELIYQIYTTINHNFPELFNWMREIDDCRKKSSKYELAAHITACIAMFLFKTGSRNEYNQKREDQQFKKNYKKLFGLPMPHGDSVHNVIALLDENQLEQLKQQMVKELLKRKVFHKSRYRGHWFRIAVDGSGVVSFDQKHCDQCLHKTSKKGKTSYFHTVLEAKLITANGFSISMVTEWIENPTGDYDKQDCERKAFRRLATRLKQAFPRLPIIILADGLYPFEGFFAICKANKWAYLITFKSGNLKTVWEEIEALKPFQIDNKHQEISYLPNDKKIEQIYRWVDNIDYHGYQLNWLECRETVIEPGKNKANKTTVFVHITDLALNKKNIANTSITGRLRWKIENEGFNALKNGGYAMEHKWARKSYLAMKNYFQFMQIAHLINQLMVNSVSFQETYLKGKNHPTLKSLWQDLMAAMAWSQVKSKRLKEILSTRIQFRFIT